MNATNFSGNDSPTASSNISNKVIQKEKSSLIQTNTSLHAIPTGDQPYQIQNNLNNSLQDESSPRPCPRTSSSFIQPNSSCQISPVPSRNYNLNSSSPDFDQLVSGRPHANQILSSDNPISENVDVRNESLSSDTIVDATNVHPSRGIATAGMNLQHINPNQVIGETANANVDAQMITAEPIFVKNNSTEEVPLDKKAESQETDLLTEDEESNESDVGSSEQESVDQYNPPQYPPVVYKKGPYQRPNIIPDTLNIQGEYLPGEEKQTLHERFSKLQDFQNKNAGLPSATRVFHSPARNPNVPLEYPRQLHRNEVYESDSYRHDFKSPHSWKTQAKIANSGSSVVTVPCDGKANLLGVPNVPMKSPLPPGVLEEPIANRPPPKPEIPGHLLDFIEERNSSMNSKLHKHLLNFLPDKKSKAFKAQARNLDKMRVLTKPLNHSDEDDGVMLYEEDSNDGMDRKLQEFDDDIIEEEDEEDMTHTEDCIDNSNDDGGTRAMTEDARNGNLADAITSAGRRSDEMMHSAGDDSSSDDNDYSETDDNYKPKLAKTVEKGQNFDDDNLDSGQPRGGGEGEKKTDAGPETRTGRQTSAGNVAWIVDGGGGVGATGTVFHLRLVGSVEVSEEKPEADSNTSDNGMGKRPRKEMVTEAVSKLKVCVPCFFKPTPSKLRIFVSF